jgi:hypothetical protein
MPRVVAYSSRSRRSSMPRRTWTMRLMRTSRATGPLQTLSSWRQIARKFTVGRTPSGGGTSQRYSAFDLSRTLLRRCARTTGRYRARPSQRRDAVLSTATDTIAGFAESQSLTAACGRCCGNTTRSLFVGAVRTTNSTPPFSVCGCNTITFFPTAAAATARQTTSWSLARPAISGEWNALSKKSAYWTQDRGPSSALRGMVWRGSVDRRKSRFRTGVVRRYDRSRTSIR